jgi:hypothetical protein
MIPAEEMQKIRQAATKSADDDSPLPLIERLERRANAIKRRIDVELDHRGDTTPSTRYIAALMREERDLREAIAALKEQG